MYDRYLVIERLPLDYRKVLTTLLWGYVFGPGLLLLPWAIILGLVRLLRSLKIQTPACVWVSVALVLFAIGWDLTVGATLFHRMRGGKK